MPSFYRVWLTRLDEGTQRKVPEITSSRLERFFLFSDLSSWVPGPAQEDRWREMIQSRPRPPDPQCSAPPALKPVSLSCRARDSAANWNPSDLPSTQPVSAPRT